MNTDKITLLIQGPLSIYTTFMMYRYADSYPIILVIPKNTPKTETILKEIHRVMTNPKYNISLFMYDDTCEENILNQQNRYYHFLSTHLGLTACKTEYVIKVRSDEFYSDLTPFIKDMMDNKNKIITNDVFFRNSKTPYHPSDHLVGGKTKDMLEIFHLARKFSEEERLREDNPLVIHCRKTKTPFGENLLAAEQQFGVACIMVNYTKTKLETLSPTEIMMDRFSIVPSSDLGMFRVAFNSNGKGPKEFFDSSYFNTDNDIDDIEEYK